MNSQSFPQKLHGIIFTEVVPEFLREVNPKKLVELGVIVRTKGRERIYEPLTDSLRKIQWVKLVGLKAISIEKEIASEMEPNALASDPIGQTAYALCVTDVLIHAKSALDSMAVFLSDMLSLNVRGGDRDFKKPMFRQLVAEKDPFLKQEMKKLEHWFERLQEIRDEWIHRSSIRCRLIVGPSTVGVLPIPKHVSLSFEEQGKLTISEDNFWSTKDFIEYHYSNLLSLFLAIVDRSLQIERQDLKESPPIPAEIEKELVVFPFQPSTTMTLQGIKMKIHKSVVDW
jgi:hypothetical protein